MAPRTARACICKALAKYRVVWAGGRGVWYACSRRCIEGWEKKQKTSPEVVAVTLIGHPRPEPYSTSKRKEKQLGGKFKAGARRAKRSRRRG